MAQALLRDGILVTSTAARTFPLDEIGAAVSGTCSNRQSIRLVALEGLIINGLRQRLMAPELVEEFVRAVQKELNLQRREEDALRDAPGLIHNVIHKEGRQRVIGGEGFRPSAGRCEARPPHTIQPSSRALSLAAFMASATSS
jgi:hypothetical protein